MKIYLICPVRQQTRDEGESIEQYVKEKEFMGDTIYYPKRDAPQNDKTGYNIVMSELKAMRECEEVHVLWDVNSKDSHFDLGMAVALGKKIRLMHLFQPDGEEKSYVKAIKVMNKEMKA